MADEERGKCSGGQAPAGGWLLETLEIERAYLARATKKTHKGIKLSGHNPTPGRPQGSPLRTSRPPPLQRPRSGDPCGRPGVGHSSSRSTLT